MHKSPDTINAKDTPLQVISQGVHSAHPCCLVFLLAQVVNPCWIGSSNEYCIILKHTKPQLTYYYLQDSVWCLGQSSTFQLDELP